MTGKKSKIPSLSAREARIEQGKKEVKLKKFLLEIPEEIWEKWKDTVPRSISLKEALVELLKKEGGKK